jgi:hypothetical protein
MPEYWGNLALPDARAFGLLPVRLLDGGSSWTQPNVRFVPIADIESRIRVRVSKEPPSFRSRAPAKQTQRTEAGSNDTDEDELRTFSSMRLARFLNLFCAGHTTKHTHSRWFDRAGALNPYRCTTLRALAHE